MGDDRPIQYGPPPLHPGYRCETPQERAARHAALDLAEHRAQEAGRPWDGLPER